MQKADGQRIKLWHPPATTYALVPAEFLRLISGQQVRPARRRWARALRWARRSDGGAAEDDEGAAWGSEFEVAAAGGLDAPAGPEGGFDDRAEVTLDARHQLACLSMSRR
jgi:hypothetical protein